MNSACDSEDGGGEFIPVEIMEAANIISLNLLPAKSRQLYTKRYNDFKVWRKEKNIRNSFAEEVMLCYFQYLSTKYSSSTLWAYFSMLKACIQAYDKLDISTYNRLIAFIKQKHQGYKAKKAKAFTSAEVAKFCYTAPDEQFLVTKVILAIGVSGCCRRQELTDLTVDNVIVLDNMLVVTIPYTKTYVERSFTVVGEFFKLCKKYIDMRPSSVTSNRFFLSLRNGKLLNQAAGINTVGAVPKIVAKFLKLEEPEKYTSHCIRRTSATVYVDSGADEMALKRFGKWKSSVVAQGYVADSMANKKKIGEQIMNAVDSSFSHASAPVTAAEPVTTSVVVSTDASRPFMSVANSSVSSAVVIAARPVTTAAVVSTESFTCVASNLVSSSVVVASTPVTTTMSAVEPVSLSEPLMSDLEFPDSFVTSEDVSINQSKSTVADDSDSLNNAQLPSSKHKFKVSSSVKQQTRIRGHSVCSSQSSSTHYQSSQAFQESSSEFKVGNACFKFYNCNVTINVTNDK